MDGRKILSWGLGVAAVAIVLGYSYFAINGYVRGPSIEIYSPVNGFSTTTAFIVIRGKATHSNNVFVNGAQTAVDLGGNFSSQLILAPGYNIIKITAKDNYERTTEEVIETILVDEHFTTDTTTTTPLELNAQKRLLPTGQATTSTINNF